MSKPQVVPFLSKIGDVQYAVGRITGNDSLDTELGICTSASISKAWLPIPGYYPFAGADKPPRYCSIGTIKLAPLLRNIGWIPSSEFNPSNVGSKQCPNEWGSLPAVLFYVTLLMFIISVIFLMRKIF